MRKVLRGAVVAAVFAPAVMLSIGSASADTYQQYAEQVGPNGSSVSYVISGTTANGDAYYTTVTNTAGPDGTTSSSTHSSTADDVDNGLDADGLLGGLFD